MIPPNLFIDTTTGEAECFGRAAAGGRRYHGRMHRNLEPPKIAAPLVLLLALAGATSPPLLARHGAEYRTLTTRDGTRLRYALVLPEGFDPARTYPVLLALPPGAQNEAMVESGLSRYWGRQAARRGWVVVSPVAPGGRLFFQGSEALVPELLDHLASEFHVEGGTFHLAGQSNGGLSAFRIALDDPSRFRDLVVLPGVPPGDEDFARLARLRGLRVALYVGGRDTGWRRASKRTQQRLRELGIPATLTVVAGEGHVMPTLAGDRVMELLDGFRPAH